jgi:predicted Co/Zn/Cd cation transporter (cation efflux family)
MDAPIVETDLDGRHERRALAFSMLCAFILAIVGVTAGVITASEIILFDGFYTFLGIGLSWLALRISRVVAAGPTSNYPFGREALTPLIIGVEGVALLATCAFASFNATLTIVHGGSPSPTGWALLYAAIAFVGPVIVSYLLRRWQRSSELVAAEATQWFAGAMLGVGMLIAFAGSQLIQGTRFSSATKYVDPVLVIVACALFIIAPLRMIRGTFIELVEGVPDDEIQTPVLEAVEAVRLEFSLPHPKVRVSKVGRKIYIEVDFIVSPEWKVQSSDTVRRALMDCFDVLPHDTWLTLEFTADGTILE